MILFLARARQKAKAAFNDESYTGCRAQEFKLDSPMSLGA
jgi:hypothetical protein